MVLLSESENVQEIVLRHSLLEANRRQENTPAVRLGHHRRVQKTVSVSKCRGCARILLVK